MPLTLTLPKLSPTMTDGVIARWACAVGDELHEGDLVCEVATDKATMEVHTTEGGFVRELLVGMGEQAQVNQPIALLSSTLEESLEGYLPEWGGEGPPAAAPPDPGPPPKQKAAPPPAPAVSPPATVVLPQRPASTAPLREGGPRLRVSPLAKKLAQQRGLDLSGVQGTGPGGRIVARDLELAPRKQVVAFGRVEMPLYPEGAVREEPMTRVRQVIGERLSHSKQTIPHFYVEREVAAEALVELRGQLAAQGVRISYNDLVLRAVALALRQHPAVNSGLDPERQVILRYLTVDICVAVSMKDGLITPILRNADLKHVGQIAEEVRALALRAREGQLRPEEYQGGSFTVSNLGMLGVTRFQPIINPPQGAILGVGAIREKGQVLSLTVACDHRIVDGADAARFLHTLAELLEAPAALLVGGGPTTE